MKLFVEILGNVLYRFIQLLLGLLYFSGMIGCIYGIIWIWRSPGYDMKFRICNTVVFVIGFFFVLGLEYFYIKLRSSKF